MDQPYHSKELKPGYDLVFTVTDYYDGPRQGIAGYLGHPHFYDCSFDETKGDYSELYYLTSIEPEVFDLALEDWAIWERWNSEFRAGNAPLESHPALPVDRQRHEQLKEILDRALTTDHIKSFVRKGHFDVLERAIVFAGTKIDEQVLWIEP